MTTIALTGQRLITPPKVNFKVLTTLAIWFIKYVVYPVWCICNIIQSKLQGSCVRINV